MSNHERSTTERPYLSIGEVLGLLLDEFPDVTISKIRFLESQGLIEPERTASGYRKFYDADVDRLRFILREQRENYLPLKVIRDRLEGETPTGGVVRPEPTEGARSDDTTAVMTRPEVERADAAATAPPRRAPDAAPVDPPERPSDATVRSHPAGSTALPGAAAVADAPAADGEPQLDLGDAPAVDVVSAGTADATAVASAAVDRAPRASDEDAASTRTEPAPAGPSGPAAAPAPRAPAPPAPTPGQFSRHELLGATGIDGKLLDELESYGLVTSRSIGQQAVYDGVARQICEIAGAFNALGIEVRHLRTWKTSAERESGLFEQRILPLLRQRNPAAREQSAALLTEMATLGANLRHVLITQALRQYTAD